MYVHLRITITVDEYAAGMEPKAPYQHTLEEMRPKAASSRAYDDCI